MTKHPTQPSAVPMHGDLPAWYHLLRQVGYPTKVKVLDFETYFDSEYSMKKLSTIEYIMDSRYEELGVADLTIDAPFAEPRPKFWFGDHPPRPHMEYLKAVHGPELAEFTIVMQNAAFDASILARKYGVYPRYPIDLFGLARHDESRTKNDLRSLALRHGLPAKGDTNQFNGLRLKSRAQRVPGRPPAIIPGMTDVQRMALAEYAEHDDWLEWELFTRLFPRLSNPATELRLMKHTLEIYTRPTIRVRAEAADALVVKMAAEIEKVASVTGHTTEELSGTNSFGRILGAALDEVGDTISRYMKSGKPKKDGTPRQNLAIAKNDPELEQLQTHQHPRVRELIAARTAVKSWPLHISRVQKIKAQAGANGGLLGVPFKYCGAHTHRWSGGEDINLQNLGARGHPLIAEIRYLLEAGDDHLFVIVDAAQIEARVLTWIAGQDDWNLVWRDPTRDLYCEFATRIAGTTVKNTKKHKMPPALKKWHDRMRGMGKVGVLGCGYGMGASKAQVYAATGYDVDMTFAEAELLVKTYRMSVPMVTRFWRIVEQKFKAAAKYREPGSYQGLRFFYDADLEATVIRLPSGRDLRYHDVKVSVSDMGERLWMPDKLTPGNRIYMWGGYLTENIVQSISRDILGEAVLACEDRGYPVPYHCHDEVVCRVPKDTAEKVLPDVIQILSTPPTWGPTLPLAAEGKISHRYEK